MDGRIISFTEQVAEGLKKRFKDDPGMELKTWIKIAQTREAMVTRVYGLAEIDRRLPKRDARTMKRVAGAAINGIWVQEEGHTTLLGAIRTVKGDVLPVLGEIQGRLEGEITRAAAAGSLLARMLIAVGAALDKVPDFAKEIHGMPLGGFFKLCRELEETAARGYDRMLDLANELSEMELEDEQIQVLPYEFARILREERYHALVFDKLNEWMVEGGEAFQQLDTQACVKELRELARKHFELGEVRRTEPRLRGGATRRFVGVGARADAKGWISDGGLGALFAEFDLAVPVANRDQSMAALA